MQLLFAPQFNSQVELAMEEIPFNLRRFQEMEVPRLSSALELRGFQPFAAFATFRSVKAWSPTSRCSDFRIAEVRSNIFECL